MLTIHNIEKLEGQKVANKEWTIKSVYEGTTTYRITISTPHFPYQRIVELSRFVEFNKNGIGHYYFFNEQARKTHASLTLEQIKDMDNIVKSLNWFAL